MKVRRALVLAFALSLLGTASVTASSLWGDFEGFSRAKLYINNVEKQFSDGETPAFLVKGSAVLPVRMLADSLQALVKWDNANKTVNVFKPNVHMFVAKEVGKDYSVKQPFGKVKKGDTIDFAVFAQVDSLDTSISSFKISIETPSGEQAVAPHEKAVGGEKDSFWYPWPFTVTFSESGNYIVKFSVKLDDSSDYVVVSKKVIVSE
ncbi:stalk domain-containing protein [Paenibacillus hamazuiensis]|uniref:stalk domain-containing protein n=1 Tax=Paenibacillus hamazuiensis TaxID=2936508 RepID=UPI00200CB66E|nr:stalk domain-containing protein [Paenibacillus hamazuiensis]